MSAETSISSSSAELTMHHLGRAAGRRRVAELLDRFELTDAARKPLSTYSGGMRRRLDLAMTLVGDPGWR